MSPAQLECTQPCYSPGSALSCGQRKGLRLGPRELGFSSKSATTLYGLAEKTVINPFSLSLLICEMGSEGLLLRGAEGEGGEGHGWHLAGSPQGCCSVTGDSHPCG